MAENGDAAQRLAGDLQNFTDINPVMIVGRVLHTLAKICKVHKELNDIGDVSEVSEAMNW